MHLGHGIRKLRVRAPGVTSPGERVRIQRSVEALPFDPSGLPPAALLIVRRVALSAPAGGDVRERGLRVALDDAQRRALRPALANDGDSDCAEAVLFEDMTELIACLAEDIARGSVSRRWWWQVVLRNEPALRATSIGELVCNVPQQLPGVVTLLAERGSLAEVLVHLGESEAVEALRRVGEAHGVDSSVVDAARGAATRRPVGAPADPAHEVAPESGARDRAAGGRICEAAAGPSVMTPWSRPPWHGSLGRARLPSLAPAVECLVGVSIELVARPAVARSPLFAKLTRRWARGVARTERDSQVELRPALGVRSKERQDTERSGDSVGEPKTARRLASRRDATSDSTAEERLEVEPCAIESKSPRRVRSRTHVRRAERTHDRRAPEREPGVLEPEPLEPSEPGIEIVEDSLAVGSAEDGVATRLGGVLYLINALDALGVPEDYDDWRLGERLGAWGSLELIARCLCAGCEADLGQDPIWQLLAELAGRDVRAPLGTGVRAPDVFLLPQRAVDALGVVRSVEWSGLDGRLRLRSEGVTLFDGPMNLSESPSAEARHYAQEILGPRPVELRHVRLGEPALCPLARPGEQLPGAILRFGELVAPFIRQRVGDAVDPAPVESVCEARGTVFVTRTHVDLVCSIDDVSLGARRAGLDRDPGWVPELGRIVTFHFE